MKISQFRKKISISTSVLTLLIGFLISPFEPARATGSYSLTKNYTTSIAGNIARLDGKIYGFKDASNLYVFNEAADTITGTVSVTTNPYQILVTAGDKIIGVKSDGFLYYFFDGDTSARTTVYRPCGGTSWNQANGITSSGNYLLITCYVNKTVYLYDVSALNTPTELANAKLAWTPLKATIANGYAYVGDLTSTTNVRKFALSTLNSAPYTTEVETTTVFSTTSINASLDISSNPTSLRITSDSNSVWTISATPATPFKITQIDIASNAVTTTTLSDYVSGSNPRYTINDISSDGSTLFISFSANVSVVGFDKATNTPNLVATPSQSSIAGILVLSDAFWVSGATGLLRYSLPRTSNSNASDEVRRKRQAAIDAARLTLVSKIKAGNVIVNPDLTDADLPTFNAELAKRANADFSVAAKAKDFGFNAVRTIVTKYSIYQDIENGVRSNVSGRLAFAAGIVPASVKRKQTLMNQVMNALPADRSTVEDIDKLIAELAKAQEERQARKDAIINKIATRK
jgi:hypothetical protein